MLLVDSEDSVLALCHQSGRLDAKKELLVPPESLQSTVSLLAMRMVSMSTLTRSSLLTIFQIVSLVSMVVAAM